MPVTYNYYPPEFRCLALREMVAYELAAAPGARSRTYRWFANVGYAMSTPRKSELFLGMERSTVRACRSSRPTGPCLSHRDAVDIYSRRRAISEKNLTP